MRHFRNTPLALTTKALLCSLTLTACAPISGPAAAVSYPLSNQVGQTVRLEGVYAAWAPCTHSGPKTRSDWVLTYTERGASLCVFVTGGLPTGVVPPPSLASVGLPAVVNGKVALNEAGKPYVVFAQAVSGSGAGTVGK